MDWIKEVENEANQNFESKKFVKENSLSIYEKFFRLAEAEAERVNKEMFDGQKNCAVTKLKEPDSFKIAINTFENNSSMIVSFYRENIIRVVRRLEKGNAIFPETIAVRYTPKGYKITFEPERFDGETRSSEIEQDKISRMLLEPVLRDVFELHQKSYIES